MIHWDHASRLNAKRAQPQELVTPSNARLQALLALLALAVKVGPALLRELRVLLGLPSAAEVAAWISPDVVCNGVAIALRNQLRPYYIDLLQTLPLECRQSAARCIQAHHVRASSEIAHEEARLAQIHAAGALPASTAHYRQVALALQQAPESESARERRAYLMRAGHRCDPGDWERVPAFALAWAWANPQAIASGKGLPCDFPIRLLPGLYQQVFGEPQPGQVLRLLQRNQRLLFEASGAPPTTDQRASQRLPCNLLAQWDARRVLQWRGGEQRDWVTWESGEAMAALDLSRFTPLEVSDGQVHCLIAPERPPWWAVEWGRDRAGLYALCPNPWGAPVRVGYPLEPAGFPLSLFSRTLPRGHGACWIETLTLELDEIGVLARFTVKSGVAQSLRWIAPGEFLMGSPATESQRSNNEGPQHRVAISAGFWLADTACTQGLWQAVMGKNPSYYNVKLGGGPLHPVEQVTWHMTQAFLQRLEKCLPDCRVTLPTEAEWEYASHGSLILKPTSPDCIFSP